MRGAKITVFLLLSFSTANATVYSWRDTSGVLVMTNDEDEVPVEAGGPVITYSTTTTDSDGVAEEPRSVPTPPLAAKQVAATSVRGSTEPARKAVPPGGRDLGPDIGNAPPSTAGEPQAQTGSGIPADVRAALQPDIEGLTPPDVDIRSSAESEGPRIHGRSLEETRAAQDAPASEPSREIGPAGVTTTVASDEGSRRGAISEERLARATGPTSAKEAGTASTSSFDDWLRVDPRELLLTPRKPPRVVVRVVSPSSQPLSTSRTRSLSSAGSMGGGASSASSSSIGRSRGRTPVLQ